MSVDRSWLWGSQLRTRSDAWITFPQPPFLHLRVALGLVGASPPTRPKDASQRKQAAKLTANIILPFAPF
jgi:hypothetical protein